ncbi:PhnD/SsuA/transferrin family substrate-binding protein [Halopiger djelfimassiliensis]|uniref:PhnD/SsuA/transferrin family substrate-binding protein n=1 Tax=Halopiger djelfimassiliensis TaxID=1293047 RepID=UPI000677CF6B|nr:PhnD/SsuA/transferrin family substrate-binding protein [Halopiger djelfimassiliensis]
MPRKTGGRSTTRRTFLGSSGVVGLTALSAGCLGNLGAGDADDEITMILNPAESSVEIKSQYRPLIDHIESEVDISIEVDRAKSYTATLQALRSDRCHLADTSPSAAVAGSEVGDIVGIRVQHGAARYFSLITTMPDSGIEELSDLEGETIAMGERLSVSGALAPMRMLKDAGLDTGTAPDGDPVDFTARYAGHDKAREHLFNDDEIVAATTGAFATAAHVPKEQFKQQSDDFVEISADYDNAGTADEELQLLAVSDPLPRAPIMARSNWDDPIRDEIETAILEAEPEDLSHEEGYDGDELWFSNVVEGSHEDYEPIAEIIDELGLEFADIS